MTSLDPKVRASVNANCISVWNKQTKEHVELRPDGTNFKYIEWLAGPHAVGRTPSNQKETCLGATKQEDLMNQSCAVHFHGVIDFDYPIPIEGKPKTLKQILTTLYTKNNWTFPLFSQINKTKLGEIVGICH